MKKHSRRLMTFLMHSGFCAATVFGALYAQAATLGHSRVTSAPDQPLRIVVQIKDLSALDLKSIAAQIAPAVAWQEAGLNPPVALDSLSSHLLPGLQDNVMQLVLQSRLVPTTRVVDVLVDLSTAASTQRHQVSVLQTQPPAAVQLAPSHASSVMVEPFSPPARVTAPASAAKAVKTNAHAVLQGQTLHGIARNYRDESYNDQQLMAALLEANPRAFINGNMNLLRAGARLAIPDVETIVAISPQQARQLYQTQLEQFDQHRQRVAKGEPSVISPEPAKTEAPIAKEKPPVEEIAVEESGVDAPTVDEVVVEPEPELELSTDRLQLSAENDAEVEKDQQTATAQDLTHTAQRLSQLALATESTAVETVEKPSTDEVKIQAVDSKSSAALNTEVAATSVVAAVASTPETSVAALAAEADTEKQVSTLTETSWWAANAVSLAIGIFVLLVLLVAWFLRRAYATNMEYAEIVPANSVRPREKTDTAEAEFREIN